MSTPLISMPEQVRVLVVDDEPDIHAVTRLNLRAVRHFGEPLELLGAETGAQAVEVMRANPDIAVILLDVVMETSSAGLDACRAIRELNPFVRILLRTGQPGTAPEKETIDGYDIDGYLPKAELTSTRLYSAVRTAIRAWERIVEIERHRRHLATVHDCAVSLRSFDAPRELLGRVLDAAVTICPSPLAVLRLETFEEEGNPRRYSMHLAAEQDGVIAAAMAEEAISSVSADGEAMAREVPGAFGGGFLVPLRLHHELGHGFLHLGEAAPDEVAQKSLTILAAHVANALYASLARAMLAARAESPLFESMTI